MATTSHEHDDGNASSTQVLWVRRCRIPLLIVFALVVCEAARLPMTTRSADSAEPQVAQQDTVNEEPGTTGEEAVDEAMDPIVLTVDATVHVVGDATSDGGESALEQPQPGTTGNDQVVDVHPDDAVAVAVDGAFPDVTPGHPGLEQVAPLHTDAAAAPAAPWVMPWTVEPRELEQAGSLVESLALAATAPVDDAELFGPEADELQAEQAPEIVEVVVPPVQEPLPLVLTNPAETGLELHYMVGEVVHTLRPGESHEIGVDAAWRIRFHRGGDFGNTDVQLSEGTFRFQVGADGWELESVPAVDTDLEGESK